MMNRRDFLKSSSAVFASLSLTGCSSTPSDQQTRNRLPNIVFILADDLGWADVGYHGSEIQTPNIDRLAETGVKLEHHYVMPTCSPTRCGLMSGRFPSRFGVLSPTNNRVFEPHQITLARALRDAGYDTAIAGKWHLGSRPDWGAMNYGFNHAYGSLAGGVTPYGHHYKKGPYTNTWQRNDILQEESGHVTDLIGAEAVHRIKAWADSDQPFFLYVPFTAPHIPIKEPDQYIDRYKNKIADESRRRFAACVSHLDDKVGQIVEALERTGKRDNTLIVFTSDNGGSKPWKYHGRYPESDAPYPPCPVLGNNKPLRGMKGQLYEGGIRVPAVVNFKGVLKPGSNDAVMHIVDWMPTLCSLSGYYQAADWQWDGHNMWPVIAHPKKQPKSRTLYWRTNNQIALRQGDWKLIVDAKETDKMELYNVSDDPYEQHDRAAARPEIVSRLKNLMKQQLKKDKKTPLPFL